MVKPEPERRNRNSLTTHVVLYKPSPQQPVTRSGPCQRGLGGFIPLSHRLWADGYYSRLRRTEVSFPSPLELNSEIAAPSPETPREGPSRSGGRG